MNKDNKFDVELGVDEALTALEYARDRWQEAGIERGICGFGCKIYNTETGARVLWHNSAYGCVVTKEHIRSKLALGIDNSSSYDDIPDKVYSIEERDRNSGDFRFRWDFTEPAEACSAMFELQRSKLHMQHFEYILTIDTVK